MAQPGPEDLLGAPAERTASDDVYVAVRQAILDGSIRPGERVVEEQMAANLGVSRTPVREALVRLERENLVARSGRGMAVRSFSVAEVEDIYDLRAHVESYAARLAAARITEHELTALRRFQDELVRELDQAAATGGLESSKRLARLNQRFHFAVVQAARSAPLERIVGHVLQTPLIYKSYLWYDDDEKDSSAAAHDLLIGHLAQRSPVHAEETWRAHLEFGRDVLVERLTAHALGGDDVLGPRGARS